ncbi:aldehyde dehydrogenase family protein [Gordonia sp. (in: high G+C Gram-positive bacteria)]|uniref:aldehyde dehydrogenase family protein n=1 Tax=Gordonia sp. (in: high G+C Gram-positive bacteria) TaxID=84139 RepID=UPI003C713B55
MSVTEIATTGRSSVSEDGEIARRDFRDGRTRALSWGVSQLQGLLRFVDECEVEILAASGADLGRRAMASLMADIGPVRHEIRHTLSRLSAWTKPTSVPISAATVPGKTFTILEPKGVVLVLVLVEESVRPRFVERLLKDSPVQAGHDTTHIVNRHHLDRRAGLSMTHGGETFGGVIDVNALMMSLALMTDPDLDSELMREEIFGPVLPLVSVPSIDTAIEHINDHPKSLALYLFTESMG